MGTEEKNNSYWSIELGFYPGIMLGFRTYPSLTEDIHVLYIPFVDIALIKSK
jgi:hypothetical protein